MSTFLQLGNQSYRAGDPLEAIGHYLQALEAAPFLQRSIAMNLALARALLRSQPRTAARPRVVVVLGSTRPDTGRADDLARLYADFANVRLLALCDLPAQWPHAARLPADDLPNQALKDLARQPCDIVHLLDGDGVSLIYATLAKHMWDARIVCDVAGAQAPSASAAPPAWPATLQDPAWKRLTALDPTLFDGITRAAPGPDVADPLLPAVDERWFTHDAGLRPEGRRRLGVDDARKVVLLDATAATPLAMAELLPALLGLKLPEVLLVVLGQLGADLVNDLSSRAPRIVLQVVAEASEDERAALVAAADAIVQVGISRSAAASGLTLLAVALGRPALARLQPGSLPPAVAHRVTDVADGKLPLRLRDALAAPRSTSGRDELVRWLGRRAQGQRLAASVARWLSAPGAAPVPAVHQALVRWAGESQSVLAGGLLLDVREIPAPTFAPAPLSRPLTVAHAQPAAPATPVLTAAPDQTQPAAAPHSALPTRPPAEAAATSPALPPVATAVTVRQPPARSASSGDLTVCGLPLASWHRTASGPAGPDLAPLALWLALHGQEWPTAVAVTGGTAPKRPTRDALGQSMPAPTVTPLHRLADVWHATDALLRWHIEPAGPEAPASALTLDFLQFAPGDARPRVTARATLEGLAPAFVDVPLLQPLFPLLVAVRDDAGALVAVNLLPFPSLCRGGFHHGELLLGAEPPSSTLALLRAGHAMALELLDLRDTGRPLSVAGIDVELEGATGAEPLFQPATKEWLAAIAAMEMPQPVGAAVSLHPAGKALAAALQAPAPAPASASPGLAARVEARRRDGAWRLVLSADAMPSLAALASRRLASQAAQDVVSGSYAVIHPVTRRPRSLVTLPAVDSALADLQPAGCAPAFPRLRRVGPGEAAPEDGPATAELPLAVRLQGPARTATGPMLMPIAPDREGPLLRRPLSADQREAARVSIVLRAGPKADLDTLLGSLTRQTLAARAELLLGSAPSEALAARLQRDWAGRHTIMHAAGSPSQQINALAQRSGGTHLLFIDGNVLLHDPRTLETLLTMALAPRVASASCVLVREIAFKKGSEVRFCSGGLFPSHVGFQGRAALVLEEPVTSNAFPHATYPVLGNPLRLSLIDRQAWQTLGGLDQAHFPAERADIDFALRALREGWRHLCTSAVTASAVDGAIGVEHVDTHALQFLPLARWQDVLTRCAVIRDVA